MTRPYSILVVSTSLNTGGAQRVASTLLSHLDRSAYSPSLAVLRNDIGYMLHEGATVHDLLYRNAGCVIRAVRRLRQTIECTRPDLILSNLAATNLVTGWALQRRRHRPIWIARIGNSPKLHDGVWRSML